MRVYEGQVEQVVLAPGGSRAVRITCPQAAVPAPGQYVLAADETAILGTPLFLWEGWERGFLAAPPVTAEWQPGAALALSGPLGHGFQLPSSARNLALAAFGETPLRLLPLASEILRTGGAVALFADGALPSLPAAVEAFPLEALSEALAWADFLALDLPLARLGDWRAGSGIEMQGLVGQALAGQALVSAPMPCAGIAVCGACAVPIRRAWKYACRDGPVFDLRDL